MVVLVSPRLAVIDSNRQWSTTVHALALAPLDLEGYDGAAALLLGHGQFVLRMRRQAGVEDTRHLRPGLPARLPVAAHAADCASMRSFSVSRPFSSTQALKADRVGPAVRRNLKTSSVSFFAADGAAQHAALAVEILGGRVDDQVGAQFQRTLQDGRAEAVIDRPACRRRGRWRKGPDVGDLGQRIGGRFQEEQLGVRADRRARHSSGIGGDTKVVSMPKRGSGCC
jgi:hypothetical protein